MLGLLGGAGGSGAGCGQYRQWGRLRLVVWAGQQAGRLAVPVLHGLSLCAGSGNVGQALGHAYMHERCLLLRVKG
jgi:hypothetical protein